MKVCCLLFLLWDVSMNNNMYVKSNVLIVEADVEIDHHRAERTRKSVDFIMDNMGIDKIIFDFRETQFMDSSGIGLIMGRYEKAKLTGGRVVIANMNSSVDRVIKMSGLDNKICVRNSLSEAIDEMNAYKSKNV